MSKSSLKKRHLLLPVYIIMVLVIFILPFFSSEGYSIIYHTTSQLGAQMTPNAWVMNIVFFFLGIACIIESWLYLKKYWFQKILLTIFGLSLIFTAIFKHAPIHMDLVYDLREDQLHSFFASMVGFSFTIFAFSAAFIELKPARRLLAVLAAVIAVCFSLLIFNTVYAGIWQRLMFIISFAWLIIFLKEAALDFKKST
ncbi:DUF998 domain-containing protein [Candidatus Contubernalis alkaliaceticus]|uniref:DUF998 domain-containing protein n=1 Tax=Candidatus Contubernalis alkaliaceticus TaxID=338645 RepID=UPI001F4BFA48|nr:DUF998 domain-containing protein [Candidatus Contubernalis alkalaceticus]UNC92199.1 DUF998 domain-containing protein [Candidatus Contubernalis alkalaceticus]